MRIIASPNFPLAPSFHHVVCPGQVQPKRYRCHSKGGKLQECVLHRKRGKRLKATSNGGKLRQRGVGQLLGGPVFSRFPPMLSVLQKNNQKHTKTQTEQKKTKTHTAGTVRLGSPSVRLTLRREARGDPFDGAWKGAGMACVCDNPREFGPAAKQNTKKFGVQAEKKGVAWLDGTGKEPPPPL